MCWQLFINFVEKEEQNKYNSLYLPDELKINFSLKHSHNHNIYTYL